MESRPDWATQSDRLRWARETSRLGSARRVAEDRGWPVSTYVSHENGSRLKKGLSEDDARKYARAFRVDLGWLMTGAGAPRRSELNSGPAVSMSGPESTPTELMPKVFRWHLAEWRIFRGLTQGDIARKLGATERAVHELERGARPMDDAQIGLWAAALDVEPTDLLRSPDGLGSAEDYELWKLLARLKAPQRREASDFIEFLLLRSREGARRTPGRRGPTST
jgi:transcriptional regulator with XRE-family HTH domain